MEYDIGHLRKRGIEIVGRHAPEMSGVVNDGCYANIFKALRRYPERTQRRVLDEFYAGFPNGEEVAKRFYIINNIPWLSAESLEGREDDVKRHFSEHLDRLAGFYSNPSEDWHTALCAARNATQNTARGDAQNAVAYAADDIVRYGMRSVEKSFIFYTAQGAINDVKYEIVHDLLKKDNPWDPLLDIYEKGLLVKDYEKDNLLVVTWRGVEEVRI